MTDEEEFLQEFYGKDDIKLTEKSCATCNYYMTLSYCDADPVCKERAKWSKIAITDKKQAVEYILSLELGKGNGVLQFRGVIEAMFHAYVDGLKKGRQQKWHDLRKDPNDLPKCTENEQIIFYVHEYYTSIDKYINHYCLGFYKKSFMDDDVKLFVERSKGYECEHSTEEVFCWCELPKFEE